MPQTHTNVFYVVHFMLHIDFKVPSSCKKTKKNAYKTAIENTVKSTTKYCVSIQPKANYTKMMTYCIQILITTGKLGKEEYYFSVYLLR